MSTAVQPFEMSLKEFQARPRRNDRGREELIEGELVVSPDPKADHAYIVELIREALRPLLAQGYFITNNSSCVLPPRSMPSPDLLVVRRERMMDAVRRGDWMQGAPDLVIEISSPSNRRLQSKADLYLRQGTEQVWTVYPKRRVVIVSTEDGPHEAREGETVEFSGVVLNVSDFFAI
jgi:Uma2 family endonuclease